MTPDAATAGVDVAVAQLDTALDHARTAFARAVSAVGSHDSVRLIAGDPVCIRFAGDALVEHLAPALEHHPVAEAGTQPILTINVWDEASTGAPVPELPHDGPARHPGAIDREHVARGVVVVRTPAVRGLRPRSR